MLLDVQLGRNTEDMKAIFEIEEILRKTKQSSAVVSRTNSGGWILTKLSPVVEAPFSEFYKKGIFFP
jgi:hypothetical protein